MISLANLAKDLFSPALTQNWNIINYNVHMTVILPGDFDKCVTSVEYITFHVHFVVVSVDPLGPV